jgi:phage terminase Nu1 subunit (DNA packaging protein)
MTLDVGQARNMAREYTQKELADALGISPEAVSMGLRDGRCPRNAVRLGGPKGPLRLKDLTDAVREWNETGNYEKNSKAGDKAAAALAAITTKPPERSPSSSDERLDVLDRMREAAAEEKKWKAKKAELEFRESAVELVSGATAENEVAKICSEVKSKMLGVASRAKSQLPHLTPADVECIDLIVREALEALSGVKKRDESDRESDD